MATEPLMDTYPRNPNFSILYLLKTWLRQSYDELGNVFLGSSIMVGVAFISFSAFFTVTRILGTESIEPFPAGAVVVGSLFLGAWGTMWAWLAVNLRLERILTHQHPTWSNYAADFKRTLFPALWTTLFLCGSGGILLFNLFTYPLMFDERPLLRMGALAVTGWIIIFVGLLQVHLIPFLVHQDRSFFTALRRAMTVTVWKPFRAAVILLVQIVCMMAMLVPPLWFIVPGFFAVLSNVSLLILLDDWRDPYEKSPEALRAGV